LRVNTRECKSERRGRIKIGHAAALIPLAPLPLARTPAALSLLSAASLEWSKFLVVTTLLMGKRLGFRVCQILAINTRHLKSSLIAKGNVRRIKRGCATTLIPLTAALATAALPLSTALLLHHSTYHSLFCRKAQ
jgi:hypothetical protein